MDVSMMLSSLPSPPASPMDETALPILERSPKLETAPSKTHPELQPLFTWVQLKAIIGNGHLNLLQRHPADLAAYLQWKKDISEEYGDVQSFVAQERLKWSNKGSISYAAGKNPAEVLTMDIDKAMDVKENEDGVDWFKASISSDKWALLVNDWPYSVPRDVAHYVIWSKVPILHPLLIPRHIPTSIRRKAWAQIRSKGMYGIIGGQLPTIASKESAKRKQAVAQGVILPTPPSSRDDDDVDTEGNDSTSLNDGNLAVASQNASNGHVEWVLVQARYDIESKIQSIWPEDRYESLYFANPPVLQSVPDLPHFHVLVKMK